MRNLAFSLFLLVGISAAQIYNPGSGGGGGGTVTSVSGTANQITVGSPTTTPALSIPSDFRLPGTINLLTLTQPATSATFTLTNLKTFAVTNSVTLSGTDGTTMTFPTTSKTIMANDFSNQSLLTTLGDELVGGTSGAATRVAGPTSPNGVPQSWISTPSGGVATQQGWALSGVPIRNSVCTSNVDAIVATDRASLVIETDASSCAVSIAQAGTTGFGTSFVNANCNGGAGTVTITPTTSTISYFTGSAYTSGAANVALTTGQCLNLYSDNTNYFGIKYPGAGSGTPSFPVTVAGTVTSGGIPYFSSTTVESSSAILNTNILVKGGGAGGAPTNSSVTDNGTLISSTEALALGTSPPAPTAGTGGFITAAGGTAPSGTLTGTASAYANASNFWDIMTAGTDLGPAVAEASIIGANVIPKAIGTNPGVAASLLTDAGTTLTYAGTGGLSLAGSAPALVTPGTTPYLNKNTLEKGTLNTCTFALTTGTFTLALSPVSLCTFTLPNAAVTWYWSCTMGWSNPAGTTPTFAEGVKWAQAPSSAFQMAAILTTNANVGTELTTSTTTNANILATGTITNSATIFQAQMSGTFTGSATSGTFSPTVSLTGTSATGTAVGGCTIQ